MTNTFRDLFRKALKEEQQILRPYFINDELGAAPQLETEETYLRLRLTRMFLRNRREWFKTKYPIVHMLARFAGIEGRVETHFVAQPEIAGNAGTNNLDEIVTLDQTLLGPLLYRGGDLDLLIGLYAAPADDWAQRFIGLAEGVSQLTLNSALTTAISVATTIKSAVETSLVGDGVTLKLGLDKELKANEWLAPGYLVMIAAPDDTIDRNALVVEDGELLTKQGRIYREHDYIVLAIEVTDSRSDWQSLGYGHQWQTLLKTASEADDVQRVKDAYLAFSGAVMSSVDLSWRDRSAIVKLAQKRVKAIRDARTADSFLESLRGGDLQEAAWLDDIGLEEALEEVSSEPVKPFATDWLG